MCLCVRLKPPSLHSARPCVGWGSAAPSPRRVPPHLSSPGALMMEQQKPTCPQCSRMISAEDTIVFGHGRLGHLDCRRPRVLSAEERRAVMARDAARSLVKRSLELRDAADVAMREAEAALH